MTNGVLTKKRHSSMTEMAFKCMNILNYFAAAKRLFTSSQLITLKNAVM